MGFIIKIRAMTKVSLSPLYAAIKIPVFTFLVAAGISAGKGQATVISVAEDLRRLFTKGLSIN